MNADSTRLAVEKIGKMMEQSFREAENKKEASKLDSIWEQRRYDLAREFMRDHTAGFSNNDIERMAKASVFYADALINELRKEKHSES